MTDFCSLPGSVWPSGWKTIRATSAAANGERGQFCMGRTVEKARRSPPQASPGGSVGGAVTAWRAEGALACQGGRTFPLFRHGGPRCRQEVRGRVSLADTFRADLPVDLTGIVVATRKVVELGGLGGKVKLSQLLGRFHHLGHRCSAAVIGRPLSSGVTTGELAKGGWLERSKLADRQTHPTSDLPSCIVPFRAEGGMR